MPSDRLHVTQRNGKLIYSPDVYDVVTSREPAIQIMVNSVVEKHNIIDDFDFVVRIADGPWDWDHFEPNHYAFCTKNNKFHEAFPDFHYIGQKEAGVSDYTTLVNSYIDSIPQTNKIGWIGAYTCGESTPRPKLGRMAVDSDYLEVIVNNIPGHLEDGYKYCQEYMTYQQQVDRWKYLIDVEGCGWSGRFKLLLSSPRIVFFVDRPWQEWYFGYMEPWKHYVPVSRDLSDLHENYLRIENDTELQNYIKSNVQEFKEKYLTREKAEDRIYEIIQEVIARSKNS